jgi:hypothetical protein
MSGPWESQKPPTFRPNPAPHERRPPGDAFSFKNRLLTAREVGAKELEEKKLGTIPVLREPVC